MKRWLLVGLIVLIPLSGSAEELLSPDRGAAGLDRALKQLSTTGSVLHIVAHPDDEDAGTLAYLSRKEGVRTMVFSLTRGEGGANLISSHFFDALGVLRTLEFLKACEYYGAELFYARAVDYGYSKNIDEALRKWGGKEELLRDAVRVIRREKPTVILSRFSGTPRDGHGHHHLSGVIAIEAFTQAADPAKFPEQIKEGLAPWQAKKLYVRPRQREDWTVEIDSGEFNPLIGASYYQVGRFGFGFHRCQGFLSHEGRAGSRIARYKLLQTSLPNYLPKRETSLFDGLGTSYLALSEDLGLKKSLREIDDLIEKEILTASDNRRPEAVVQPLVRGLKKLRQIQKDLASKQQEEIGFTIRRAIQNFESAIIKALGIHFTARVTDPIEAITPGASFNARLSLVHRSTVPIKPLELRFHTPEGWLVTEKETFDSSSMKYNEARSLSASVQVSENTPITRFHYQRDSVHDTFYTTKDKASHTLPFPQEPAFGRLRFLVDGEEVRLKEVLRVKISDIHSGTRFPPLRVVPPISVTVGRDYGVLPTPESHHFIGVTVRSHHSKPVFGTVRLHLPNSWVSSTPRSSFHLSSKGEEYTFPFHIAPTEAVKAGQEIEVHAKASFGKLEWSEGFETISAKDVLRFNLYKPARQRLRIADIKIAKDLIVGYLEGSGDEVAQSLGDINIDPIILEKDDFKDLSSYDVIIVGVRAYAVRPDIKTINPYLLEYVKNGGTLVVQYQTPEFDKNFGPYPYTMNRPEEVSEEDAPVKILKPKHPIFNTPNKITAKDFEGWVEQRGSKFWRTWDSRYTPLLESNDKGQDPQRGGMLIAEYGKGYYIYSAYSWYRQLPHGVPGAYRLFANMLSLKKK